MKTREIPAAERTSFLSSFGRLHAGAIVTVSVATPQVHETDVVIAQALYGISEEGDSVLVQTGKSTMGGPFIHRVARTASVQLEQTDEGADCTLQIKSANGANTFVRLRSPVLPASV